MGSVKRDIYRNGREHDIIYEYTDGGIAFLLKDIYKLSEKRLYKGDIDATAILTDLRLALDSDCLTPRMRQIVALYYFVGLTEEEVALILDSSQQAVNKALSNSLERIAEEMMEGKSRKRGHAETNFDIDSRLYRWLTLVGNGDIAIYNVPDEIFTELLENSKVGDRKAAETLKQREIGAPVFEIDGEEYPALSEDQFRWRDRRMTFVSDMRYANDRLMGYRRMAYDSDNETIESRQKLYKVF